MSDLKELLIIEPSPGFFSRIETKKGRPVSCPVCYGRGGWYYNEHDEEYYKIGEYKQCDTCKGTKRVWPKITVEWEADIPESNERK